MPSANYRLIRSAILAEQQVTCTYGGHYRELCPHILGHTREEEKLLAFQFGGESSRPLPPGGQWKCLSVAAMRDVKARSGPWHAGGSHRREQTCVADIDLDINVDVRRLR
jgi:hypothetical protein